MKILLQYQDSARVIELGDKNEIYQIVEETFSLKHQSYFLKRYEADFDEYVDLLDEYPISNKDKI